MLCKSKMPEQIILFTDPGCGACQQQAAELQKAAAKLGKSVSINQVDLSKFPNFPVEVTPTWAILQNGNEYYKHEGVVSRPDLLEKILNISNTGFGSRRSRFGAVNELVNSLAVYGKNFPNGEGFNIPGSFYKTVENNWGTGGTELNAGVGGARSLGPGNASNIFTNDNVNNIRMVPPGSTDDVFLRGNRDHAMLLNKNNNVYPGMITNSANPQVVNMTGFGSRRNRFGYNLYSNMGPVPQTKYTKYNLFDGAQQFEPPRPNGVNDPGTFIGNAPIYNPLNRFGKKQTDTPAKGKKKIETPTKGKKLNLSGKKAVNIKINIRQRNR
jgi:hypothetical protein